jgi:hypothetical protein
MTRILRVPRQAALTAITVLVASASLVSFAESYRGLLLWARSGLGLGQRPAPLEARPSAAIPGPERRAIRPAWVVLHGQVVQPSPTERKTP